MAASTAIARADVELRPVTADFDAEFARAADALEADRRAEGQAILEALKKKSALVPAWRARIGLLVASDDLRRQDFPGALRELDSAPAAAIGLEPYRLMLVARALAGSGRAREAAVAWRAAWEADEPFAMRPEAGRRLSGALARGGTVGEMRDALTVANSVAALVPADAALAAERIRLALGAGDRPSAADAARELVLAGVDPASAPAFARAPARDALARLTPAERGRLGRRLSFGPGAARGIRLLRQDPASAWPEEDRAANLLALARALGRFGDAKGAEAVALQVPEDLTPADWEARLYRADLALAAVRRRRTAPLDAADPLLPLARRPLLALSVPPAPSAVRTGARERLIALAAETDQFDEGLDIARALATETPGSIGGFEALWKLAWSRYRAGDFPGARQRLEALSSVYRDVSRARRLHYWRARCLDREGRATESVPLFESLAAGEPADVYALFSRKRAPDWRARREAPVSDPTTATATYRKTDELLRLRFFEEAAAEARALPPTRGRDLRLAEAEFALGRFPSAAAAVKRAFPEIGTAAEARVPDGWRRLFYPIELGGFLATDAQEFRLDPAVLRGLVRQESVFDAEARSRAGALGLMQLMPATAKSLARSVLRVKYRRAFLYDPSMNARLGAAYLRTLFDRFSNNPIYALAAYNGGPTRMARVLRENAGLPEDEVFESHPAYETRDYVRRVMLYAESYRGLYP